MAYPARHQVEKNTPGREDGSVIGGERLSCRVVDMTDQPNWNVEVCVVTLVLLGEGRGR